MAYLTDREYQRRKQTDFIVIHCSATKPSQDIGVDEIRQWHIKERKWIDVGYHYVIRLDGTLELGRPTWAIGSHVEGRNWQSVGICLVGGINEQGEPSYTFNLVQMDVLKRAVWLLIRDHYKKAQVVGHHDIEITTKKACPSFDAKAWWAPFQKQVEKEIANASCSK